MLLPFNSSLSPPCPSKALPPPLTAWLISDTLRSTSNPTGSFVYFSFLLMDSHMLLLSFFTWYFRFSLFTFRPPTFVPDFGLMYLTFRLRLWQLYSCWQGGNSSAWSLRITTVSGMFPVASFSCICYRTEDYHCVSVSHLFSSPLS